MVGNEFVARGPKPKSNISRVPSKPMSAQLITPAVPVMAATVPVINYEPASQPVDVRLVKQNTANSSFIGSLIDFFHRYSLGVFAILILIVLGSGIQVASIYLSQRYVISTVKAPINAYSKPLRGPNMSVAADKLGPTVQQLAAQPIGVNIANRNIAFSSETIGSWIKQTTDRKTGVGYIHVDQAAVANSLKQTTEPFAYAPRDQISVTREDGTSRIISAGRNGTSLTDTSHLSKQIARDLLAAKGMQIDVPLQTIPFNSLTPANFEKFIEVDVSTKRMYMYRNGQLERTFLISAGAPETPTPLGQYKIYSKLTRQDMRGFNANGTRYFQPNVQWVNYFSRDVAIHGNYWRPTSWFGNINSSHGCVSLPNDQARWVYDWAPVGTTVVTHN